MSFTEKQQGIINGFNPDMAEEFNKLKPEAKLELLATLEEMIEDNAKISTADQEHAIDFEETSVTGKEDREDCLILKAGGIGLTKGTVLIARFLGTMPMFTDKKKEYWKEVKIGEKKWYLNMYFKFATTSGKEFGIYQSPMLRILKKVFTHTATPNLVSEDPIVRIEYHGEIESAERLKEEFNFELQKGNSAHAFRVYLSKDTKIDRYAVECVNYLRSPIPSQQAESSTKDMSELEKMQLAFANQAKINAAGPQAIQVEHKN